MQIRALPSYRDPSLRCVDMLILPTGEGENKENDVYVMTLVYSWLRC